MSCIIIKAMKAGGPYGRFASDPKRAPRDAILERYVEGEVQYVVRWDGEEILVPQSWIFTRTEGRPMAHL